MKVICLQDEAFYQLLEQAVERLKQVQNIKEDRWVPTEEAMRLLGIKSKTTLQDLRNKGKIRYSQQGRRIILYDRNSIMDHLDANAKEKF